MVEITNKHLKYHYLFVKGYGDFEELKTNLPTIIDNYNNKPLDALHGRTAKEKRRIENAQKCCQVI